MNQMLTLAFLISMLSCGTKTESGATEATASIQKESFDSTELVIDSMMIDSVVIDYDSILQIGNQKFAVTESRDTQPFKGMDLRFWPKEDSILALDPNVSRIGDSLVFNTSENGNVCIENVPYGEDDEMESAFFYLQGDQFSPGYWELFAVGYEYHWSVLVSKTTGDTTCFHGRPLFSPDGKYVITGNPDLEAAFTENGFEFYNYANNSFKRIGQLDPLNWGPYVMKWISNSEILVKAGTLEYKDQYQITFKNIVLRMLN